MVVLVPRNQNFSFAPQALLISLKVLSSEMDPVEIRLIR
jgi:hypothetical protein